jgi:hypothetical protein
MPAALLEHDQGVLLPGFHPSPSSRTSLFRSSSQLLARLSPVLVGVCVRACVRSCVRGCVCTCVCECVRARCVGVKLTACNRIIVLAPPCWMVE